MEGVEPRLPEVSMEIEPVFCRLQATGGEAAMVLSATFVPLDEPCLFQDAHMPGNCRGSHVVRAGEFSDCGRSGGKLSQDSPPRRIG